MKDLNQTNDYKISADYIFSQLFTHACLKKNKEIINCITKDNAKASQKPMRFLNPKPNPKDTNTVIIIDLTRVI